MNSTVATESASAVAARSGGSLPKRGRIAATTIHKAQGQTVDRAFVLGSDTLYQEAGYVALSRGRAENRIYLVAIEHRPEAHTQEATPPEPVEALTQALRQSHAQELAVDSRVDRDAIRRELSDLMHEQKRLDPYSDVTITHSGDTS